MTRLLTTCFALLLSFCVFAQVPSRSSQSGTQSETSLITFGLDEDQLSAFAKTQVAEIAEEAMAADVYSIELFGHTDQQGDVVYNADLAKRRAASVAQALFELGIEEDMIQVRSFGESRLLEEENNEQAFAKNRRVELVLTSETIRTEERLFEVLAASRMHREVVYHDEEHQLVGKEGVRITVPAQAFVFADGSPLPNGAQVEVTLEEATRPSSMMAHRLSTNGKGGRLSTGGMVRVTGRYENQTLHLATGKAIDVEIPTQEFDTEMRLYVGDRRKDAGMDWDLDAGESIKKSTRIVDGTSNKKRVLGADEIAIVEEIKASLAKRNRFLAMMKTERLEQYKAPHFPDFKALPKEFDPKAGIPRRPFIPEQPTRSVAEKGLFKKSLTQRKLDETFIADSIAYAKEIPNHERKLAAFAEHLVHFEAETPDRAKAHQAKIDAAIDFRVGQAQTYLVEEYSHAAAQTVLNWKEKLETTGPYAKKSLKKLRLDNLVGASNHADPDIVVGKALGPQILSERFAQDTAGFEFVAFERNFLQEKGLAAPMDSVKRIQKRIEVLFYSLKSKRHREANKKADELNEMLTASYSFQIRTPMPAWHNCDHPLPEGLFQLLVSKPGTAPTYLYSQEEKTLDYFPAGRRAAAVYDKPVLLSVLSFGVVDDALKLATTNTKASRSQQKECSLEYRDASLTDIEQALVALDTSI